jgi:hypothetical protein
VAVTFIGYTNLPNNARTCALLCLSNQDSVTLRWRDHWVEVDGSQDYNAPTVNRSLPWFSGLTLKKGESETIAVGDPQGEGVDGQETRWRFTTVCSPYSVRFRLFDFARAHNLPLRIGRFKLLDTQQMLRLTTAITNTSVWLGR